MFYVIYNSIYAKMSNLCLKTSRNEQRWQHLDSRFSVKRARLKREGFYNLDCIFQYFFMKSSGSTSRQSRTEFHTKLAIVFLVKKLAAKLCIFAGKFKNFVTATGLMATLMS